MILNLHLRALALLAMFLVARDVSLGSDGSSGLGAGFSTASLVPSGKRWAIVVGAGHYEKYQRLQYAGADATAVADTLEKSFGFAGSTVRLLTDDSESEMRPTAGHILGELEELLSDTRLDKSDMFVFYFAGHGIGLPSGDYLLPIDARPETAERLGVPVREIFNRFSKAGLKNVVLIADACRTGAKNDFGLELQTLASKTHIAVLLGCSPGGSSLESDELKHGVFTHYFLQALEDGRTRDPVTGAQWLSRVAQSIVREVPLYTQRVSAHTQTPWIWAEDDLDVLLRVDLSVATPDAVAKSIGNREKSLSAQSYTTALTDLLELAVREKRWKDSGSAVKALAACTNLEAKARVYAAAVAAMEGDERRATNYLLADRPLGSESIWRQLEYIVRAQLLGNYELALGYAKEVWHDHHYLDIADYLFTLLQSYGELEDFKGFLIDISKRLEDSQDPIRIALDHPSEPSLPSLKQVRLLLRATLAGLSGSPGAANLFVEALHADPHSSIAATCLFQAVFALRNANRLAEAQRLVEEFRGAPEYRDAMPYLDYYLALAAGAPMPIAKAVQGVISHRYWLSTNALQLVRELKGRLFDLKGSFLEAAATSKSWRVQLAGCLSGLQSGAAIEHIARLNEIAKLAPSEVDFWCSFLDLLPDLRSSLQAALVEELDDYARGRLVTLYGQFAGEYRPLCQLIRENDRRSLQGWAAIFRSAPNMELRSTFRLRYEIQLIRLVRETGSVAELEQVVDGLRQRGRLTDIHRRLAALPEAWIGNPKAAIDLLTETKPSGPDRNFDLLLRSAAAYFSKDRDLSLLLFKQVNERELTGAEPEMYFILLVVADWPEFKERREELIKDNRKFWNKVLAISSGISTLDCLLVVIAPPALDSDFDHYWRWMLAFLHPYAPVFHPIREIAIFVGQGEYDCNMRGNLGEIIPGHLSLSIAADGKVTGSFLSQAGVASAFAGTVDGSGWFMGTLTGSGAELKAFGRLLPIGAQWWNKSLATMPAGLKCPIIQAVDFSNPSRFVSIFPEASQLSAP